MKKFYTFIFRFFIFFVIFLSLDYLYRYFKSSKNQTQVRQIAPQKVDTNNSEQELVKTIVINKEDLVIDSRSIIDSPKKQVFFRSILDYLKDLKFILIFDLIDKSLDDTIEFVDSINRNSDINKYLDNIKLVGFVFLSKDFIDSYIPNFIDKLILNLTAGNETSISILKELNQNIEIIFEKNEINYLEKEIKERAIETWFETREGSLVFKANQLGIIPNKDKTFEIVKFFNDNQQIILGSKVGIDKEIVLSLNFFKNFFKKEISNFLTNAATKDQLRDFFTKIKITGIMLFNEKSLKTIPIVSEQLIYSGSIKNYINNYSTIFYHPQVFKAFFKDRFLYNDYLFIPLIFDGKSFLNYYKILTTFHSKEKIPAIFPEGSFLDISVNLQLGKDNKHIQKELFKMFDVFDSNKYLDLILANIENTGFIELPIKTTIFNENSKIHFVDKLLAINSKNLKNSQINVKFFKHLTNDQDIFEIFDTALDSQKTTLQKLDQNKIDQIIDITVDGNLKISFKDLQTNPELIDFLNFLVKDLKIISIYDILNNKEGDFSLFFDLNQFLNYDNQKTLFDTLKKNRELKNFFYKQKVVLQLGIPLDPNLPAFDLYNFIIFTTDPKLLEAKLENISKYLVYKFSESVDANREKDILGNLESILDIVTDERRLSDVLKEKLDEDL